MVNLFRSSSETNYCITVELKVLIKIHYNLRRNVCHQKQLNFRIVKCDNTAPLKRTNDSENAYLLILASSMLDYDSPF